MSKGAADSYTRKEIDGLGEFAAVYGAKGLAWLKVTEEGLKVQSRSSSKVKKAKH